MSDEQIIGTANPKAIAALLGLLQLRAPAPGDPPVTELREDGSVIWRLRYDLTIEMWREGDRFVRWHLDRDDA